MGVSGLLPALLICICPSYLRISNFVGANMLSGIPMLNRSEHSQRIYTQQRLPLTLYPSHYRIKLSVPLTNNNFTTIGEEWITLNCTSPTQEIIFNLKNIKIEEKLTTVYDTYEKSYILITGQSYDEARQMYTVTTATPLLRGKQYDLYLQFSYDLNDHLVGFYKSSYVETESGDKRWLASTQFSPTSARRAFPCWDEPAFKSRFTITLGHPMRYHSLSNMPLKNSVHVEGVDNWIEDNYQTTLPMSTYLVAFIISDLSSDETTVLDSGLKFTLWSRKDALSQTKYAAETGPKILSYLEMYFGIGFPLPKQDVVAIPDFGFSAMENWGLITFRESALLFDPGKTSLKTKMRIAYVMGHELAHQWFGNLVTPAWWNDLWLKEGFASFIGYRAVDHIEPKWQVMDQFATQEMHAAMRIDCLNATHQIEVPVDDPNDIVQIFDVISYEKGASVIHMMSHFLGEQVFRAGLSNYLRKYMYSNTCQDELWLVLTEEAKSTLPFRSSVKDIMDTWTLQAGYPVVTITRDYKNRTATIKQDRFYLLDRNYPSLEKWWIPLSYTTQSEKNFENTQPRTWLAPSDKFQQLTNIASSDWLLVNLKQSGYYRVNYDDENWSKLHAAFPGLPSLVQAQLLWDAFNLAAAGRTKYATALGFSLHLYGDTSYFPWSAGIDEFQTLKKLLKNTPAYNNFKIFVLHLIKGTSKNLTFSPEYLPVNYLDLVLQIKLIRTAAHFGHEGLVQEGKQMLADKMLNKDVHIMADYKYSVYCAAIRYGGVKEWDYVWQSYLKTNIASDRVILLQALACSNNNTVISRYLDWILDEGSGIRKQDGGTVFQAVALRNADLAFDFLKNHWEKIQSYFGLSFRRVSVMIESLGFCLKSEYHLTQLKKLRSDHSESLGSTSLSFEQTIEWVTFNVQWMQSNYNAVSSWLEDIVPKLK